jgi:hypothetical protein
MADLIMQIRSMADFADGLRFAWAGHMTEVGGTRYAGQWAATGYSLVFDACKCTHTIKLIFTLC